MNWKDTWGKTTEGAKQGRKPNVSFIQNATKIL